MIGDHWRCPFIEIVLTLSVLTKGVTVLPEQLLSGPMLHLLLAVHAVPHAKMTTASDHARLAAYGYDLVLKLMLQSAFGQSTLDTADE